MKNKRNLYSKLLYFLAIIGAVPAAMILYTNPSSDSANHFLMGYMLYIFLMLFYIVVITFINMRKLSWDEAKKSIIKFVYLFLLFSAFNFSIDYLFRSVRTVSLYDFSAAFGVAFGISFFNVTFLNRSKQSEPFVKD